MIRLFAAAAVLAAPVGPLQAQHALILQKLHEWNGAAPAPSAERIQSEVRKAAARSYPASPGCAASGLTIETVSPASAERFVFTAILQGRMRNAWTVGARLPGCDAAPVRFMVMQDGAGALSAIRVNRGDSLAWDSLIGDTLPLARIAAAGALKRQTATCELTSDAVLGVTRVSAKGATLGEDVFGVRYAGSWSEVWPLAICGRTVEVTVDFTADGDGGAYTNVPGDGIVVGAP